MNSESLGDSKEFIDYNLETAVQMDPFLNIWSVNIFSILRKLLMN